MADYIDRNELVGNLDRFAPEHLTPLLRSLIEKQPTADVVEVVRCKDCRYWKKEVTDPVINKDYGWCLCPHWEDAEGWDKETVCTDFCSYGERVK